MARGYPFGESLQRSPPIGVGLARRVAKEDGIVVAWTPEHKTTATHFKCGGTCGRFHKAEARRAADHATDGAVKEIRGLKVCQNPECNAPINCDLNAAKTPSQATLPAHSQSRVSASASVSSVKPDKPDRPLKSARGSRDLTQRTRPRRL